MKAQCKKVSDKVHKLENAGRTARRKTVQLRKEVGEVANANLRLTQAAIRCEQDIEGAWGKIEKCEVLLNLGAITISGLEDRMDENAHDVAIDFFEKKMKIKDDLGIAHMQWMGGKNKLLLVKFMDQADVGFIFSQVGNLKALKNKKQKPYQINEYQTEKQMDVRRRQRDILMENRRMPVSHQMTTEVIKGKLYVNGDKYAPEVVPPTTKDTLLLTKEGEQNLRDLELESGDFKHQEGSSFYSYAARTRSHDHIKQLYEKLKLEHGSATHIICGYRLFGTKHHLLQDYSDDKEIGGGRAILSVLKDLNAFNIVVFVVRYKAGNNIGGMCFQIIKDVTKSAVMKFPEAVDYGKDFQHENQQLREALTSAVTQQRGHGAI